MGQKKPQKQAGRVEGTGEWDRRNPRSRQEEWRELGSGDRRNPRSRQEEWRELGVGNLSLLTMGIYPWAWLPRLALA